MGEGVVPREKCDSLPSTGLIWIKPASVQNLGPINGMSRVVFVISLLPRRLHTGDED